MEPWDKERYEYVDIHGIDILAVGIVSVRYSYCHRMLQNAHINVGSLKASNFGTTYLIPRIFPDILLQLSLEDPRLLPSYPH
jgi:hypothetical protein